MKKKNRKLITFEKHTPIKFSKFFVNSREFFKIFCELSRICQTKNRKSFEPQITNLWKKQRKKNFESQKQKRNRKQKQIL